MNEPKEGGDGTVYFMAGGMVLCCGLPLVLASGALAGAGTWLLDGGWLAIAAAAIAAAVAIVLWRRRGAPGRSREGG